jgi:hypothetical protein
MAAPCKCGHFFAGRIMDESEQASAQGDKAAKVIASIIIAGISAMFSYGILRWIIFE